MVWILEIGLKTGVENDIFFLKTGQDLENRAAHPYQEFPGKTPVRGPGAGCKSCHRNHRIEYNVG